MKKFAYIAAAFALSSCAAAKTDYSAKTDREIFDMGLTEIRRENYPFAVEHMAQVEYNHPYSSLVGSSWIMAGYAHYRDRRYDEAAEAFEKLAKFQPSNPQAPYAMYMAAMSYYDRMSPISRDQRMTEIALEKMEALAERFPDSEYAADVKPKIAIARNHLAAKEMHIAKDLTAKRNIMPALNRYQTIISKYDRTPFTPEALFRAVEIYLIIDDKPAAENMARLLSHNYPESEWRKLADEKILAYESPK